MFIRIFNFEKKVSLSLCLDLESRPEKGDCFSVQFLAGLPLAASYRPVTVPCSFHLKEEELLRGEDGGEWLCRSQPSLDSTRLLEGCGQS